MTIYSIFSDLTWTDPLTHPSPNTHPYTYPKVGVCPQIINLQTEFNYLDQMTIYSILVTWHEPTHWPTHPPNHPPIHLSKGRSVSTNHKSSNRIELSRLDQILLKFLWFYIFQPTNPLTHPSTHPPTKKTPTHGWGILHRFQIFKRNRNILIRSSLIAFLLIWGGTPLRVGGSFGWGWGWVGAPPRMCTCACMHVHACAHTHACMLNMINMAASMVAAICNFLTCLSSRFVRVRACTCVCMCLGTPPHAPRCTPTHLSPPQSCREPQGAQITKSL